MGNPPSIVKTVQRGNYCRCEKDTCHINAFFGQNVEYVNVKHSSTLSNHYGLRRQTAPQDSANQENWRRKGKAIIVQAYTGSEGSRRLRLPGKVVSPTHRPPLPSRKYFWHSFLSVAGSPPGPQIGRKEYVNEKYRRHHRESRPPPFGLQRSAWSNCATTCPMETLEERICRLQVCVIIQRCFIIDVGSDLMNQDVSTKIPTV